MALIAYRYSSWYAEPGISKKRSYLRERSDVDDVEQMKTHSFYLGQ